jgi:hypothetical protein
MNPAPMRALEPRGYATPRRQRVPQTNYPFGYFGPLPLRIFHDEID